MGNELEYSVLDAIKKMTGEDNNSTKGSLFDNESLENEKGINKNSTDIEILDYMIVFICERLKSVKKVFKGGYVLMKVMPELARYSHDIDFSIDNDKQYELVKGVLSELGETLIKKEIILSYTIKENITPTSSGGIKCDRGQFKENIGIDIGYHNLSYGIKEWNIFGFNESSFVYERILSDKLSVVYSPKRFRRAKDLYDVYIISTSCDVDTKEISKMLVKRGIDWTKTPFNETVMVEYRKAYDKLKVVNQLGTEINKPDFNMCISVLKDLVIKVRSHYA